MFCCVSFLNVVVACTVDLVTIAEIVWTKNPAAQVRTNCVAELVGRTFQCFFPVNHRKTLVLPDLTYMSGQASVIDINCYHLIAFKKLSIHHGIVCRCRPDKLNIC